MRVYSFRKKKPSRRTVIKTLVCLSPEGKDWLKGKGNISRTLRDLIDKEMKSDEKPEKGESSVE